MVCGVPSGSHVLDLAHSRALDLHALLGPVFTASEWDPLCSLTLDGHVPETAASLLSITYPTFRSGRTPSSHCTVEERSHSNNP